MSKILRPSVAALIFCLYIYIVQSCSRQKMTNNSKMRQFHLFSYSTLGHNTEGQPCFKFKRIAIDNDSFFCASFSISKNWEMKRSINNKNYTYYYNCSGRDGILTYDGKKCYIYFPSPFKFFKCLLFDFEMKIGDSINNGVYPSGMYWLPEAKPYPKTITYLENIFYQDHDSIFSFRIRNLRFGDSGEDELVFQGNKKKLLTGIFVDRGYYKNSIDNSMTPSFMRGFIGQVIVDSNYYDFQSNFLMRNYHRLQNLE